jgi:hypothetical protein
MYQQKYNIFFSKKEFYIKNAEVCNQLQLQYQLDSKFKVIIGE